MTAIATSFFGRARSPRVSRIGIGAAVAGLAGALVLTITGLHDGHATSTAATHLNVPLAQRVVAADTFPGFALDARPVVLSGAARWATAGEETLTPATEIARLRRLGFVAGVAEHLSAEGRGRAYGMSTVERFGAPAGARAELSVQQAAAIRVARDNGQTTRTSVVSGIPGASALTIHDGRTASTTVSFAYGDYYYAVGVGRPGTPQSSPSDGSVINAAQALYLQATGCAAKPAR